MRLHLEAMAAPRRSSFLHCPGERLHLRAVEEVEVCSATRSPGGGSTPRIDLQPLTRLPFGAWRDMNSALIQEPRDLPFDSSKAFVLKVDPEVSGDTWICAPSTNSEPGYSLWNRHLQLPANVLDSPPLVLNWDPRRSG